MINKKIIVIAATVLVLSSILVFNLLARTSNEDELNLLLSDMGKNFYENYYYDLLGETKEEKREFLANFTESGIKINITNLLMYKENESQANEFVNSLTDLPCDLENSIVKIFPVEDYNKESYKLETYLSCGF